MTREEIGIKLSELRDGRGIDGLSDYAIQSIEASRSSYPVSNLITMCSGLGIQLVMIDTNTEEIYPIDSVETCHDVIGMLMERYNVDEKLVYRITGVHYTIPKDGHQPLSINTLLSVCSVLKCNLELPK